MEKNNRNIRSVTCFFLIAWESLGYYDAIFIPGNDVAVIMEALHVCLQENRDIPGISCAVALADNKSGSGGR
jgi:hypothetical protein